MPTDLASKIYKVEGKHFVFGKFQGELELRPRADGDMDAIRQITYDDYLYDGLKVQENWTGLARVVKNRLYVIFRLKQADVLSAADGKTRTDIQFQRTFSVPYRVLLTKGTVHTLEPSGETAEVLSDFRPAGAQPIWKDQREAVPSKGDSFKIIGNYADSSMFMPVIIRYRTSNLLRPYLRRLDFKSGHNFFVFDPTDFDFLRANKNTIRVDNKVLDEISLLESEMRRDAYAYTLDEKAEVFDKEMPQYFLNDLGLFVSAIFDANGKRVQVIPDGDGALWSGMYAGSQAMRWLVTKDAQALANYKRVTSGLMMLMDLSNDESEFARTAEIFKPGEKLDAPWRVGKAPHSEVKWVPGGNNDMIKGLFHAFAWGFEILPEKDPLRAEIASHALRLSKLKVSSEFGHPGNTFTSCGLACLAGGSPDELNRYLLFYNTVMQPIDFFNLDKGYYHSAIADWSGVNLNMVSSVTDILIAKNLAASKLAQSTAKQAELESVLGKLRLKLMNSWSVYSDARRDFLTIAADTFGAKNTAVLNFPPKTMPLNWARKQDWPACLAQSIWGLREIPLLHPMHNFKFDYSNRQDWCPSPWPRLPWKDYTDEKPSVEYHLQSAYNYPVFERGCTDSNLWTNAMEFQGSSQSAYRFGRMDYLHIYWMGRMSGLINKGT